MMERHNYGVNSKVKKLKYNSRTRSTIVKIKEGMILFDNEKRAKRWKEYIEELFEGEEVEGNLYIEIEDYVNIDEKGPYILKK